MHFAINIADNTSWTWISPPRRGAGRGCCALVILAAVLWPFGARAIDPGPAFGGSHDRRLLEVRHEQYRRDIEQRISGSSDTFVGRQTEDRWLLRGGYEVTSGLRLWLEGGGTDSRESDDFAPMVGGGLVWTATVHEPTRIELFAGLQYADEITYSRPGEIVGDGRVIAAQERVESILEYGAGMRVVVDFPMAAWRISPSLGLFATAIDASGSEATRFDLAPPDRRPTDRVDRRVPLEEDGLPGVSFGITAHAPRGFFLRADSRLINREIVTLGAGFIF